MQRICCLRDTGTFWGTTSGQLFNPITEMSCWTEMFLYNEYCYNNVTSKHLASARLQLMYAFLYLFYLILFTYLFDVFPLLSSPISSEDRLIYEPFLCLSCRKPFWHTGPYHVYRRIWLHNFKHCRTDAFESQEKVQRTEKLFSAVSTAPAANTNCDNMLTVSRVIKVSAVREHLYRCYQSFLNCFAAPPSGMVK